MYIFIFIMSINMSRRKTPVGDREIQQHAFLSEGEIPEVHFDSDPDDLDYDPRQDTDICFIQVPT